MISHNVIIAAAGAAVAGVVAGLANSGLLHKGAVKVTSGAIRVGEAIQAETQSIVDDANDATAEARRKARIEAAVRDKMADLEQGVRESVTAQVDAEGSDVKGGASPKVTDLLKKSK